MDPADEETTSFEWQKFHLKSPESKLYYLAMQLFESLPRNISKAYKWAIVESILSFKAPKSLVEHGSVDHQSAICFPYNFEGDELQKDFIQDFRAFVMQEDVSIVGGNDNSETFTWNCEAVVLDKHNRYDDEEAKNVLLKDDHYENRLVSRKDGDWHTLFNRDNGSKIRINFHDQAAEYKHSRTPELIDIKITGKCTSNCGFCYQGSCRDGQHADYSEITGLFWDLARMEVFEVALGGGEPTEHPKFSEILKYSRNCHIVPNFTTHFMSNVTGNKKIQKAVLEYAGSFASSSLHPYNIAEINAWNSKHDKVKCVLQIPMGCYNFKTIQKAISLAKDLGVPFTLLGFKKPAGKFKKLPYKGIVKLLQDMNIERFGADTIFVKEFKKELLEIGVPKELMVGEEGAFSCYIDMVDHKWGRDSYSGGLMDFESRAYLSDIIPEHFPFTRSRR
jgi:hypothetical protein